MRWFVIPYWKYFSSSDFPMGAPPQHGSAPRDFRFWVPRGAYFIARMKKGQGVSLTLVTRLVPEEGLARLSLRPTMAPAIAAGLGANALPCVALFLLFVGAPRPFKSLHEHQGNEKGLTTDRCQPFGLPWCRRRDLNPHVLADTGF